MMKGKGRGIRKWRKLEREDEDELG